MSMKAEILVIGRYEILKNAGVLDYPDDLYSDYVENADVVLGTVVVAENNAQSNILAEICNVDPWKLNEHKIDNRRQFNPKGHLPDEIIGDLEIREIVERLNNLRSPFVQLYFRPNG